MDKKILVTRSSMPPFEEYADEIKDMWDTHWLTNMGVKAQAVRKGSGRLSWDIKREYCIVCKRSSGIRMYFGSFSVRKRKECMGRT